MKRKIIPVILGILILLTMSAFVTGGGAGLVTPVRTLSVTGTGRSVIAPDIATINIGVHTENANASEALASNNSQAQNVADALKKIGVDQKDIQTTSFSIYPQQKYGPNGENLGNYYTVDNSVFVTVRDLTKMGDILSAVVAQGANSINGIQFDVADKTKASSDARKAAIADARKQAEELAASAGVTLGQVQTISMNMVNQVVPMYQASAKAAADGTSVTSTPISGGQMTISVDVYITYEIK